MQFLHLELRTLVWKVFRVPISAKGVQLDVSCNGEFTGAAYQQRFESRVTNLAAWASSSAHNFDMVSLWACKTLQALACTSYGLKAVGFSLDVSCAPWIHGLRQAARRLVEAEANVEHDGLAIAHAVWNIFCVKDLEQYRDCTYKHFQDAASADSAEWTIQFQHSYTHTIVYDVLVLPSAS
eukprot:6059431-Amphidinium_carterae.1